MGEGYVTAVGEGRDAEAAAVADVLVIVSDFRIAYADLCMTGARGH